MVDIRSWIKNKPPTSRIYLEDSYVKEVDAEVIDYVHDKSNKYYVIFNRTIFHPGSGGQPSDVGLVLDGGLKFNVLKVLEIGDVLIHYGKLVEGSLRQGAVVRQVINWDHRYLTMKLHTAGHILDYAVMKVYGRVLDTINANHGPPEAYVVYKAEKVPDNYELRLIEEYANVVIAENRPVKVYWVSRRELLAKAFNAPNIHRLPAKESYRIVEIEGINAIPCTGTHVRSTIEVGKIKIAGMKLHPGGFKLSYKVMQ